jgi:putative peptidoglycan lipid II flippase
MQQEQTNLDKLGDISAKLSLGRTSLGLSAIAVCTKFFGFAEKLVIAHSLGASGAADIYFASMGIVLSIVSLSRELIYPSLLPVFTDCLSKSSYISDGLFRKIFGLTAVLLFIIALVLAIFPEFIAGVFVAGFPQQKKQMTSVLLRELTPGLFFLGLSAVTYTALNAQRKFFKAAWPEAALKLFILAGLAFLLPFMGIRAIAVVIGLGALGYLVIQLYFTPQHKTLFKYKRDSASKEHFRKVLLLMGPLVIGTVFSHINGLVDNLLASTLPDGSLSCLGYSKKIIDAILLIGPTALVTVVYSQLSRLKAAEDYEKFRVLIVKTFRLFLYLGLSVTLLLIGLKYPLIKLLFERGKFNIEATFGTSQALAIYALGFVTFSLETLLVYSFFALSNTKTPVQIGILCVCLDIALAITLLRPLGYLGIAAALVISKTIKVVILAFKLNKKIRGLFDSGLIYLIAKLIVTTAVSWTTLKLLLAIDNPVSFFYTAFFDLIMPAAGSLSIFILCSYLLKIEELKEIMSLLKYRKAAINRLYVEER